MHRLKQHLLGLADVSERDLDKILQETLLFLGETVEAYVRRRHGEMQREGRTNEEIFLKLGEEIPERRFSAPSLSPRQLRRLIYG